MHSLIKLIFSAPLNMKMASWSYCVLVFDSSAEPAARPADAFAVFPGCSGSEFEVGRTTSCDEKPSLKKRSPMCCASSL